jgi:hypothetical protein
MLGHNSLENFYQTEFGMVQHHKYSLTEIENLMPYELDLFVMLLVKHLKEQEDILNQRKQNK